MRPNRRRTVVTCIADLQTIKNWQWNLSYPSTWNWVGQFHLRHIQTATDLAGLLLCFNPIGAILHCTFWSDPTGIKILSDHCTWMGQRAWSCRMSADVLNTIPPCSSLVRDGTTAGIPSLATNKLLRELLCLLSDVRTHKKHKSRAIFNKRHLIQTLPSTFVNDVF